MIPATKKHLVYGLMAVQVLLCLALIALGVNLRRMASKQLNTPIDAALKLVGIAGDYLYAAADGMEGVVRSGQSAAISLQSYQAVVVGLRQTVNDVYTLLGAYRKNLIDADATAQEVARLCQQLSSGLQVKVPVGIHFDGLKPVIDWAVPQALDAAAKNAATIGERAKSMSDSLRQTEQVLASQENNRIQLNAALDQTVQTLREAQTAATQFNDDLFRAARSNLRNAADTLKSAAKDGASTHQVLRLGADVAFLAGCLLLVNAVIPLILVSRD